MSVAPAGTSISIKQVIAELGSSREDQELIQTLTNMDNDGSGTIGVKEMVHITRTRVDNVDKIKNLKKLVLVIVFVSLVVMGIMLGVTIAANEVSKDTRPESDGLLKTTHGEPVQVASAKDELSLKMMPYADYEDLRDLDVIMLTMPSGELRKYTITGFKLMDVEDAELSLFTAVGDKIHVQDGAVHVHEPDGTVTKVEGTFEERRRARALLQSNGGGNDAPAPAPCWGSTCATCWAPTKFVKGCKKKCMKSFIELGEDGDQAVLDSFNFCLQECRRLKKAKKSG